MSIQILSERDTDRRDRRATSHCDIWDMIAPELPCPACSDGFSDRLERATLDQQDELGLAGGGDVVTLPEAPVAPPAVSVVAAPVAAPAPTVVTGTARDQAADLLRMLAH